jgi:hypothetical protein
MTHVRYCSMLHIGKLPAQQQTKSIGVTQLHIVFTEEIKTKSVVKCKPLMSFFVSL